MRGTVQERVLQAVAAMRPRWEAIAACGGTYTMKQIIATGVDCSILGTLPSFVGNLRVGYTVRDGNLAIVSLTSGQAHGNATMNINFQARAWVNTNGKAFSNNSDSSDAGGASNNGSAPDLVLRVQSAFGAAEGDPTGVIGEY